MNGVGRKCLAISFAILVASTLVTMPALAGGEGATQPGERPEAYAPDQSIGFQPGGPPGPEGNGPPGHDRGSDANVSIPTVDANTTVELLRNARTTLEELELNGKKATTSRDEAVATINTSIGEYRMGTFGNTEAAIESQREAQKALRHVEKRARGPAARDIRNASETVYTASNLTSRLATREAYELVQQYEGSFDSPGQRQAAESALGNAADAIARGNAKSPYKGTVHLRNAWRHADRAVGVVERNVDPNLTVRQGPAFERNGTVEVPVSIELVDARPYAYDEATVTIDENETSSIDLRTEPIAGGSATGHYYVDVGQELTNRSVTVSATTNHDSSRVVTATLDLNVTEENVVPQPPAPDEVTEVEVDDESGATVTTRGPGLRESDVSIETVTPEANPGAYASPVVDVKNATAFHNATVTIPFNASRLDGENLSIVHFGVGPGDDDWRALETDFDPTNETASATVTSFSRFAVMDAEQIREATTGYAGPGWPVLDDLQSLSGWNTAGSVSQQNDLAVLQSDPQDGGSSPEPDPEGPVARISGPITIDVLESGTWSAADSSGDGLSYEWGGAVGGSGVTVSKVFYRGDTSRTITLTVTDDEGRTDTTSKTVGITCPGNGCPVIIAANATNTTNVTTAGFTSDSPSSSGVDAAHTSTMRRTFSVDEGVESVELNARVRAGLESGGLAKVTITGESGDSSVLYKRGERDDGGSSPGDPGDSEGPTAKVTGPATIDIGEAGTWSGTGSSGDELSYEWSGAVDGVGPTVSKTFYRGNTVKTITLTVTDDEGRTDTATETVGITCPGGGCPQPFAANTTNATATGLAATTQESEWDTISADISEYAGEEVTVTFTAADGATLSADYVSVLTDTVGNDIPDVAYDMDLRTSPIGEGRYLFTPLSLDPTVADTDADGLPDGEEIDVSVTYLEGSDGWQLQGRLTDVHSLPTRADTDGDGLTDYEEAELWGTDPLLADTSGDGFNDAVDPAPVEKTTLPAVRYKSSDWYYIVENELIVEARPTGAASEIEEITVEKHVDSTLRWGDEWQTATVRDTDSDGAWLEKTFFLLDERKLAWGEPDKISITVEDEDGNTVEIDHNVDTGQSAIAAGAAGAGAFATTTRPLWVTPPSAKALAAVTVLAGVAVGAHTVATSETIEGEETEMKLARPIPETEAVASWALAGEGMEISLPSGAVYETIGDHRRGFGWEHIEQTGVTQETIEEIIKNPEEVVERDGEVRYIIGDSSEKEKVILSILGGAVVAASTDTVEDTCGQQVYVPEETENDHPYKKGVDKDDLKKALKNPFKDKIWTDGAMLYYINKASNGVWHIVRTSPKNPNAPWGVSTSLLKNGKDSFDSGEDAEEYLEDERGLNEYGC